MRPVYAVVVEEQLDMWVVAPVLRAVDCGRDGARELRL